MAARAVPLARLIGRRIILFTLLAMLAQLGVVFFDYYRDDAELARLLIERETELLALGTSGHDGQLSYHLPHDDLHRYVRRGSGYFARVRTEDGSVLFSGCDLECEEHFLPLNVNPPDFWSRQLRPGKPLSVVGGRTVQVAGRKVLVEVAVIGDRNGKIWNVLGREVIDHMIVPMTLSLVFVLGGTLLSIRAALAPVRRAALAAEALDPMNAASHLETEGMPREIEQLASAVNRAFIRVGELIQSQKLFTSAIAHEIRTPLAILKLELGHVDHPRARKAETDLDELTRFVAQLTALARLEASDSSNFVELDAETLALETVEATAPWVYEQGCELEFESDGSFRLPGIAGLLRDAVRNLIENAVRHTPRGTRITVRVAGTGVISVIDDAPPQPERRVSPESEGAGIGLQIVRRIAGLHRGRFELVRGPSAGSIARLEFPFSNKG